DRAMPTPIRLSLVYTVRDKSPSAGLGSQLIYWSHPWQETTRRGEQYSSTVHACLGALLLEDLN
ncbi:hypothetical protein, partial [Effusibacillus lacus]|uniref:hypothetical protein n=1 Tax=Effusibacillus lacus TaxID=1348429 RepID=UPI001C12A37E